ncbi:hypothetical protein Lal_00045026 [Lupinus albus]|nr:hypothetical protein Lal_00045026 [Lupinus albus]
MAMENAPACLGKLAGALGGSPMARHPDPPRQPWLNNSKLASKFGPLGTHVPWLGSISPRTTRDTFRMASITPNGTRASPIMASLSASIRKVCHGLNFT